MSKGTEQSDVLAAVPGKADVLTSMLENELAQGGFQVGNKFHTSHEVAKRYKVSVGTARKAMTGLVSAGYLVSERGSGHFINSVPKHTGRIAGQSMGASVKRTQILVVVDDDPTPMRGYLFDQYLRGMSSNCDQHGYSLELTRNDKDALRERLRRGDVVGIIGFYLHEKLALDDVDVPLVAFGHFQIHPNQMTVVADVEGGVYEAFKHLLALGSEHVGMIVCDMPGFKARGLNDYVLGMRRAYNTYGAKWSSDGLVSPPEHDLEEGGRFLKQMIEQSVTGLFVPEWPDVIRLYKHAKSVGVRIGEDISIVGFGNSDLAEALDPAVSRIAWDPAKHGQQAIKLIEAASKGESEVPSFTRVPVKLIEGQSTASFF